jgi:hypothetical protein
MATTISGSATTEAALERTNENEVTEKEDSTSKAEDRGRETEVPVHLANCILPGLMNTPMAVDVDPPNHCKYDQ